MPFNSTGKKPSPYERLGHEYKLHEPIHRVNMPQRRGRFCSATPHLNRLNEPSSHYFFQRRGIVIAPFQHDCFDCLAKGVHETFPSTSLVLRAHLRRHTQPVCLGVLM